MVTKTEHSLHGPRCDRWQILALTVLAIVCALAGLRMTAPRPGALTAQERQVIPDQPTYPQCTIELRTAMAVASISSPASISGHSLIPLLLVMMVLPRS